MAVADRGHGIVLGEVDRLVTQLAGHLQPRAAADDDHPARAQRMGALRHQQPHHPRADNHHSVSGPVPTTNDGVQGDSRRVQHGRFFVAEHIRNGKYAAHRVHDELGVGPRSVVTVLSVQAVDAEVLAHVVSPLDAAPAEATRRV